jgi:hypothetical protein
MAHEEVLAAIERNHEVLSGVWVFVEHACRYRRCSRTCVMVRPLISFSSGFQE